MPVGTCCLTLGQSASVLPPMILRRCSPSGTVPELSTHVTRPRRVWRPRKADVSGPGRPWRCSALTGQCPAGRGRVGVRLVGRALQLCPFGISGVLVF